MRGALSRCVRAMVGWSLIHDFRSYALIRSWELCPWSLILNEHMTNFGQGTMVEVMTLCDRERPRSFFLDMVHFPQERIFIYFFHFSYFFFKKVHISLLSHLVLYWEVKRKGNSPWSIFYTFAVKHLRFRALSEDCLAHKFGQIEEKKSLNLTCWIFCLLIF